MELSCSHLGEEMKGTEVEAAEKSKNEDKLSQAQCQGRTPSHGVSMHGVFTFFLTSGVVEVYPALLPDVSSAREIERKWASLPKASRDIHFNTKSHCWPRMAIYTPSSICSPTEHC